MEKVPKIVVAWFHNFLQMNHEDEPKNKVDPYPNSTMQLQSQAIERDRDRAQRDILFHEWERHYNFSMGELNYFYIINQFVEYGSCYVQATSMLLLQKRKCYLPEQNF